MSILDDLLQPPSKPLAGRVRKDVWEDLSLYLTMLLFRDYCRRQTATPPAEMASALLDAHRAHFIEATRAGADQLLSSNPDTAAAQIAARHAFTEAYMAEAEVELEALRKALIQMVVADGGGVL